MDRDERCAARTARRQVLSAIVFAAVGLEWSRPASAQRAADCGPVGEPDTALPYRDLKRGVACLDPLDDSTRATDSTRVRRVAIEAFFTYDCTRCFALDPALADWQRALPSNAHFVRVPATHSALARLHAQAFYTATRLDKIEQLHAALYEAVQRDGRRLDSVAALAMLFASFGVEREAFASEFDSVEVYIQVERAIRRSREHGVTSVPALVIGGRYLTTPEIAGSNEAMLAAAAGRVTYLTN